MRKQLVLATALGTALIGVLPLTAAAAATAAPAHKDPAVLTVGKAGGKAVKRGAVIGAGLKKGTSVTFFTPGTMNGVTCNKASFTDRVIRNPASPGLAILRLTGQSFGKCSVHGVGGAIGVKGIKVTGLPYRSTTSGRAGHRITLFRPRTILTLKTVLGTLVCGYGAAKIHGTASNTGNVNKFSDQTFTRISGAVACPKSGNFSATFGPVVDKSLKKHPKVFVN